MTNQHDNYEFHRERTDEEEIRQDVLDVIDELSDEVPFEVVNELTERD